MWSPGKTLGYLKDLQPDSSQPFSSSSSSGGLWVRTEQKSTTVIAVTTGAGQTHSRLFWLHCAEISSISDRFVWLYFSCISSLSNPLPPIGSPSPHLCCMAGHGVRWSKLFPGGGTGRPCSVSKRLPVVEDTGRLCSIPGPHAFVALQWCSGTSLEGTAAPGWYTGQVKSNRNIHR